jgi:hypothetical protein
VKKKIGILVFACAILLSACSTDFDVIGDWKETIVVYGLLDQNQPKQYIKINKAFLGKGSAIEYAQVKDSVQFTNSLNVTLKKIKNGNEVASYVLTPDNSIPKDPGTFYGPDQANAIYSFNSNPSYPLNSGNLLTDDAEYKLVIKNNETGTEVSSQTALIKDFGNLLSPSPSAAIASLIVANVDNYSYSLRFTSAPNARIYQVILRLKYTDSTITGNVDKQLDWIIPQRTTATLDGGEDMDFSFRGQDFLKYIGGTLTDYAELVKRYPGNLNIFIVSASDDLNTFIDVNKPSTGIIQEKPEYTNITNGLGIFSARLNKMYFNKPLSGITIDSLSRGRYTKCLKFVGTNGTYPNNCQ